MTFSYTQVSQYLRCPRSYRFRYLDGWREKESRASLCFGRCFEKTLAAFFERQDAGAVLFKGWGAYRDVPLEYSHGDDWERLLRHGIGLLEQFARDNRIRIRQPKRNMQKKLVRPLANGNYFVAYVDGIGQLDGTRRLLEWKTTSARYPEQPEGLTSLDLQLVCYSWISGISDVAIVAFVRKRIPEIQYLLASITDEQRQEFGALVEATVGQIETAQFLPRPGIRFPQNGCVSCAHLGLCLGNEPLVGIKLIRQPGASDLDWLDVLDD
jgi:PD-(D/E)XK nuclease superfamily